MSTRLQVVVGDEEMTRIRRVAGREQLTVSQWVRQVLRTAELEYPTADREKKIQVVRDAAFCNYPTADIDVMLKEVETGALGETRK
jgi:hypothetical protein